MMMNHLTSIYSYTCSGVKELGGQTWAGLAYQARPSLTLQKSINELLTNQILLFNFETVVGQTSVHKTNILVQF